MRLLELGQPDFIEIKGVTFSGKSDANPLTMHNVPWHHEVRAFAQAIAQRTNGRYGTACEHVHSCCTLLADTEVYFKPFGRWRTWIDYPRFHELNRRFVATGQTFEAKDYMADTPEWAVWGAKEEGFDPDEVRFRRVRSVKDPESRPPIALPPRLTQAAKRA